MSNGNFLRSPCAGKMAEAQELRAKFPHALLGALEHCLNCQGKDLVVREGPAVEYTGDIRPEVTRGIAIIPENRTAQEDQSMGTAVKFKSHEEAERVLGPGKVPAPAPAPMCPKHPAEPQVACSPGSKRAGQYLGACKLCIAERQVGRKAGKAKNKMTPAVARNLGLKATAKAATVVEPPPSAAARSLKAGEAAFLAPKPASAVQKTTANHASVQSCPPMCTTHNLAIKFNAKGISMGGCEECRREIAKLGGERARDMLAQNPVGRIFVEHPDELRWICEQANDQVRTPEGQLVFLVRLAMTQGI